MIKIKQTLNINGWWLHWQIFSESKEVPGINGSIWEDYLCGLHPIASIVCVGSVDSHLDQFLVEFGSKHIRTLLNWKPVNTYSLNINIHPLKNKHSIYEIMKFKTEMTRGGKLLIYITQRYMAFILVQSHRTLLIYMLSSEGVWDEFSQGERKYGQEEDYKELCYNLLLWSRNQVQCHCKCFTYTLYMHSLCVAWTKIDPRERINGMENFFSHKST